MATFVVLAGFTDRGISKVKETVGRAEAFKEMAKMSGVTVKNIYWTLGRHDLVAICDLEPELPRMQWLQLLMTFLRFALPMWLLAQMQITRLLHAWLIDAVDHANIADESAVLRGVARRLNAGLKVQRSSEPIHWLESPVLITLAR